MYTHLILSYIIYMCIYIPNMYITNLTSILKQSLIKLKDTNNIVQHNILKAIIDTYTNIPMFIL